MIERTPLLLQPYEIDECCDALLECKDVLECAGFDDDSPALEGVLRALHILGYNLSGEPLDDETTEDF